MRRLLSASSFSVMCLFAAPLLAQVPQEKKGTDLFSGLCLA